MSISEENGKMSTLYSIALLYLVLKTVVCPYSPPRWNQSVSFWGDPEIRRYWKFADKDADAWKFYTPGNDLIKYGYAGRAEFPFLIDLRGVGETEHYSGIGSLLTAHYILTSCLVVTYFYNVHRQFTEFEGPQEEVFSKVQALYAPNYLWEDEDKDIVQIQSHPEWDSDPFSVVNKVSGTRNVRTFFTTPRCYEAPPPYNYENDYGYLILESPILPNPPLLQFLRFAYSFLYNATALAPNETFHYSTNIDRRVCFVATYGRKFVNWVSNEISDYKMRYRVYQEEWHECLQVDDKELYRCPGGYGIYGERCTLYLEEPPLLMCFNVRNAVGAVCGYDFGSPIICDGQFYGMVTVAADEKFCNDLVPLAFVAIKDLVVHQIFRELTEATHLMDKQDEVGPFRKPKGSATIGESSPLLTLALLASTFVFTPLFT